MTQPTVGTVAEGLYEDLEPLAYDDESQDWALLILCGALGAMFQPVDDLARDTPAGPGWSQLLDVDRCPTEDLPYLAQCVGVALTPGLDDGQQRAQIRAEQGMARGTVGAIQAAAMKYLTGSRTVIVSERNPDAYSFVVTTFTSETPDVDAVLAALQAAKPAGLIMVYTNVDGETWAILEVNYTTWTDVVSTFPTWTDVIDDTP